MRSLLVMILLLGAVAAAPSRATAETLDPRIMVMKIEGDAPGVARLADKVTQALRTTARRFTPHVEVATASLADTAVIVGCEPGERACLDAVAAVLNVDRLLIARLSGDADGDAHVDVSLSSREHAPATARFDVRAATRDADVAVLAAGVARMFEDDEAAAHTPDDATGRRPDRRAMPTLTARARPAATRTRPSTARPVDVPSTLDAPSRARWPLWISVGGAVAVAGGATMWALASSRQDEIDAAPTDTPAQLEHLADLEASARTRATVGNLLVIGGAVAVSTGVVLYLARGRRIEADTGTVVGAGVVPGGAALTIGGAW